MKDLRVISLIFLFGASSAFASELQKFETDYCTMFQEGTPSNPSAWKHCCLDHDLRFWFGGTKKERYLTDIRLRNCVAATGHGYIASAMYYAVRVGKYSPIKNKYKWGWGWKPFIGYKELTQEQQNIAKEEILKLELDPNYIKEFLEFYEL